jgi:nicotinate-nucleotide pyrophosphorylase (carboxylating)
MLPKHSVQKIIDLALDEDIGTGDITTDNLIESNEIGEGIIITKQPMVIAGIDIAKQVFKTLDSNISCYSELKDGDYIEKSKVVLNIEGNLGALLKGERTALNFLQRLSGIATHVRSYVKELKYKNVRLVDTRKTIPGWRLLEKYAVRVAGAYNHRIGLFDGVLIKDNHIAACGGVQKAISQIRDKVSHLIKIEIEVSNISELKEALESKADVIMLDNMNYEQIKEAVSIVNGKAVVEVSGQLTKKDLNQLAKIGVDIISSGAITHQATFVDLSMNIS